MCFNWFFLNYYYLNRSFILYAQFVPKNETPKITLSEIRIACKFTTRFFLWILNFHIYRIQRFCNAVYLTGAINSLRLFANKMIQFGTNNEARRAHWHTALATGTPPVTLDRASEVGNGGGRRWRGSGGRGRGTWDGGGEVSLNTPRSRAIAIILSYPQIIRTLNCIDVVRFRG